MHSFKDSGIRDIRVVVGNRANELLTVIDKLGVRAIVNPNFSDGMFSSVSEEECYTIIKRANTPVMVINHCKQVAQLSCAMGSYLIRSGSHLNLELIRPDS